MFHTKLCDLLEIKYPIIQGAMGSGYGGLRLVAAVSNAGGLGVLASAYAPLHQLRENIRETRALTDKPFGVNIFTRSVAFAQRVASVIVEEGVTIVTTGRGDPRVPIISQLKQHGVKVLPVVPTVRHALRLEAEGADAIIASGTEAGGHVGTICSLPLIPQVVDAVKIPVIAAGGIADARGFVAALALGACGIQMGTCFLAARESGMSPQQRQKLMEATEEDTVVAPIFTGKNVRVLKFPEVEEWLCRQQQGATPAELRELASKAKEIRIHGNGVGPAIGQICGMIKRADSAENIINGIIEEATAICKRLGFLADDESDLGI